MKILLVDDSVLMLGYLTALLQSKGYTVTTASSTATALEACARARPDAILMDFVLEPGRTGLEALAAISTLWASQAEPKGPRTAILTQGALTPVDAARAATLGAAVLQKPVRGQEDDFLRTIEAWLKG